MPVLSDAAHAPRSDALEVPAAATPGRWFAIWTRSRHEQVVREQLERKQVETFLPTITRWSRWKDRRKKIAWPLFPGYCFARFDTGSRLGILRCTGVVNIVSFDGEPAPIAPHEIDSIRRLVDTDLLYDPCPLIREGHDGRGGARPVAWRGGAPREKRLSRAARAVGRSDRPGGVGRGRRGGHQGVLGFRAGHPVWRRCFVFT